MVSDGVGVAAVVMARDKDKASVKWGDLWLLDQPVIVSV
jgi:hypothetical protein